MYIFSPKDLLSSRSRTFGKNKFKINWNLLGKIALAFCVAGFLLMLGIFAYFAKDLPSPGKVNSRVIAESTKIYDRTGDHILYDIHGEEKRTQIKFNDIPETLRYATISLEDQNFYSHPGFDVKGLLSAVVSNVLNVGAGRGGSTITQQFVKNSILTGERSMSRKVKELILAIEIELKFSKDEILGMYLNEIPYGSNAYGIEAASQSFFGKHASEITLDEAALLASLPQAPSYYSPYGSHTDALRGRQVYALSQMKKFGYITEEQFSAAKEVDVLEKIKPSSENITAPHFVMYVKEYLEQNYGKQILERGGLKVYTTLDWDKQQIAEQAVREGAESNIKKYKAENAALVAMDPKTGQVLAMVGSKDYFDKSIDGQVNVTIRERQPGSSFKPFVYLTAFKKGYLPETQLWDVDTNFSVDDQKDYIPKNYDGKNHGLLQMKDALAMSLNVPAVKTLYLAGIKDSITTAKSLGINSLNNKPDIYGLSLVLGGGEVTLLDHVNAYGTLATGGIHHNKTAILRVIDSNGKTLEEYKEDPGERVIDEKYVAMLDYIMSTNSLRESVFGKNNPLSFSDRPVAAKTGTTNEWRDGWTLGYTPSLVAGVWAGNNDNTIMAPGADGVFVAAPIWRSFMDGVLKNYTVENFPKYEEEKDIDKDIIKGTLDPTGKIEVCKIKKDKYCLASDACPEGYSEKKTFFSAHSILWYVNKNDPRGEAPKKPEEDPQFKNWEKAVQKYAEKSKDFSKDAAPTEKCESDDFSDIEPSIEIKSPSDGSSITSSSFNISISASSPFEIDKTTLYVDGQEVSSKDASSLDYEYKIPSDKNNSNLEIKATTTDKNKTSKSTSINVRIAIP